MGASLPRRNHVVIIILTLLITLMLLWRFQLNGPELSLTSGVQPILMKDLEGLSFKLPEDPSRNSGVSYATAITRDSDWPALELLIQSIQSYIVRGKEKSSSINVFYSSKELSKATVSRLRTLSLVKAISIESLNPVDNKRKDYFVSAIILEYLLVAHPVVVFIETGYFFGDKALSQVLKGVAKYGEVIVPGVDFSGRSKKLNPAHPLKASLPMFAYNRSSFIERVRPHLECQRGGSCDVSAHLTPPKSQSILKKGSIGLRKADERIISRRYLQSKWYTSPLLEEIFETVHPTREEEENLKRSASRICGIALDLESGRLDKLRNILHSIGKSNDLTNTLFIFYLRGTSGTIQKQEILDLVSSEKGSFLIKNTKEQMMETLFWNKDTILMEALNDGCSRFYHFSLEDPLPSVNEEWLKNLLEFGNIYTQSPQLILTVAISGEEQIWMLKELVGSIHGALAEKEILPAPKIVVLGSHLSSGNIEMIKLWQSVEYIDLATLLVGSRMNNVDFSMESPQVKILAMEAIWRRDGSVTWISPKISITNTSSLEKLRSKLWSSGQVLVEMDIEGKSEVVVEGFVGDSFTKRYQNFINAIRKGSGPIPNMRDLLSGHEKSENGAKEYNLVSLLPKPSEDKRSQNYCHLTIRPEISYNFVAFPQSRISQWGNGGEDEQILKSYQKTKIAFLVPSKNKSNAKPSDIPLIQNFLKTLINSISEKEWESFQYSVYIGYDRDDSVLDRKRLELQATLNGILGPNRKNSILFKYHLLPTAKCITLLWNILFTDAYNDGNDYFYQINDDVAFQSANWSSSFVKKLKSNNDFGVVGPNDRLWQCRLLTQSFVSRKHYEIFQWYFPTEIKDWYSDNWITNVYGPSHTFCDSKSFIRNSNTATRYNVCSQPHWQEALVEGQKTIAAWQNEQDKILLKDLKNHNNNTLDN